MPKFFDRSNNISSLSGLLTNLMFFKRTQYNKFY
jgi:hypothetical protein